MLLSDHKTFCTGHDAFHFFTTASTPLVSFATCPAELVGHALQTRLGKLASRCVSKIAPMNLFDGMLGIFWAFESSRGALIS